MQITDERFDELLDQALEQLPEGLLDSLDNVVIVVEDEPPFGPPLLGLYHGVPLTDRGWHDGMRMPDQISLFKGPLLRHAKSESHLVHELVVTLMHEIGHYHGMDEAQLHAMGWG